MMVIDHSRKLRKVPVQAKPLDNRFIYIHNPGAKNRLFKMTPFLSILNQVFVTGSPRLKGRVIGYSMVVDLDGECLAVCRENLYFYWKTGFCALIGSPVCLEKLVDEDHLGILLLNNTAHQKAQHICIQTKDYDPPTLQTAKLKFNGKICFTKYWEPPVFLKFS